MDVQTQPHRFDYDERSGFARALRDNVDAVVDGLEVIQFECEVMDDDAAARFFESVGGLVRTFATAYLYSPRHHRIA